MFRVQKVREEDYWVYLLSFFGVFFATFALYASVFSFRAPAVILAIMFFTISSSKIKRSYSLNRARIHIVLSLIVAMVLAWVLYVMTN